MTLSSQIQCLWVNSFEKLSISLFFIKLHDDIIALAFNPKVLHKLIEMGGNVNLRDSDGWSLARRSTFIDKFKKHLMAHELLL